MVGVGCVRTAAPSADVTPRRALALGIVRIQASRRKIPDTIAHHALERHMSLNVRLACGFWVSSGEGGVVWSWCACHGGRRWGTKHVLLRADGGLRMNKGYAGFHRNGAGSVAALTWRAT